MDPKGHQGSLKERSRKKRERDVTMLTRKEKGCNFAVFEDRGIYEPRKVGGQ